MRNSIKTAIKNNVVSVDSYFRISNEKVAKVKKSNEKNGTCTIEYKSLDGLNIVEPDVKVRLMNSTVVDWFPKKGDYVFIKEDTTSLLVIGDANQLVKNNIKSTTKFKKDIYSNSVSDFTGGFII